MIPSGSYRIPESKVGSVPAALAILCLALPPAAAGAPADPCKEVEKEGVSWSTRTGCIPVPLDHSNPDSPAVPIYYELSAPRSSLGSLIYFHGGPAFPRERLSDEGPLWQALRAHFKVLYFHQRGSGWSGRIASTSELEGKREFYTLDATVRDAEILWDKLLGRQKVILMGKSAGGFLALKFALAFPDAAEALILACTSADHRYVSDREKVKAAFFQAMDAKHAGFLDAYETALSLVDAAVDAPLADPVRMLLSEDSFESVLFDLSYTLRGQNEIVAIIREAAVGRYEQLLARVARGNQTLKYTGMESLPVLDNITCREFGYGRTGARECRGVEEVALFDVRALLPALKMRVLVISGRHDPVLPPRFQEEIASRVSGQVEWKIMEYSGHMVFQEQPNASAAAVLDFLGVPRQQSAQVPGL